MSTLKLSTLKTQRISDIYLKQNKKKKTEFAHELHEYQENCADSYFLKVYQ